MKLLSFRPLNKNGLRGFATVELSIGLRLIDLPIFVGANGPWAALPRKAKLDAERRQKTGADGRPVFEPVADWSSRDLADKFSAAVVDLVRAQHPGALADQP